MLQLQLVYMSRTPVLNILYCLSINESLVKITTLIFTSLAFNLKHGIAISYRVYAVRGNHCHKLRRGIEISNG